MHQKQYSTSAKLPIDKQRTMMYTIDNNKTGGCMSKQKSPIDEAIEINGKAATTVAGARKLLSQRAKDELGIERNYSRDAVYAMFVSGKIEGVRTPSANYYFLETLQSVRLDPHQRKA